MTGLALYRKRYPYLHLYRNLNGYLYPYQEGYLYLYPVERVLQVDRGCLGSTDLFSISLPFLEEFIVKVSTRPSGYLLCVSL